MIFIPGNYRLSRNTIGTVAGALEKILRQYPGDTDLANGETWL